MSPNEILTAYRMRLKRRRLLWRSFRARRQLHAICDRTGLLQRDMVLAVCVLRNELTRLPFFLQHYRALGVGHFLCVDNNSDDGSADYLATQPDVSLWSTPASYRDARFGLDWLTYLQMKYAVGHWCLMADVDELLVYKDYETRDLADLTLWLDGQGIDAFGALMLDLYPKGALSKGIYRPGQNPTEVLSWFDPGPFRASRQFPLQNLWVQGGARERMFFQDRPQRSPTLNKLPLVKWQRGYAYVNSCHSMLPPKMNHSYDGPGGLHPSGVLLHTKFLPEAVSKSETEKQRAQHFHTPADFNDYYDKLIADPVLLHQGSVRYQGPTQLEKLGLMHGGGWETTRKS
ncbi:MAG: glycosyltransferase family 2 protein [Cognatishimia sp.]